MSVTDMKGEESFEKESTGWSYSERPGKMVVWPVGQAV